MYYTLHAAQTGITTHWCLYLDTLVNVCLERCEIDAFEQNIPTLMGQDDR